MSEPTKAITIFYCYAHEDKALRDEIGKHLSPLRRQGLISEWYDRDIQPGMEWVREVEARLNDADIVLLLISPDFLSSDYCYHIGIGQAMERHKQGNACVIPIILRSCLWQDAPFGKLQALPASGKPIVGGRHNRDEALEGVAKGINNAVRVLLSQKSRTNEITSIPNSRTLAQEDVAEVLLVYDTIIEQAHPLTAIINKNLNTQAQLSPLLPNLELPEKRDILVGTSTDGNATSRREGWRKVYSKCWQTHQNRLYRYVLIGLTFLLLVSLTMLSWQYSAPLLNTTSNQSSSKKSISDNSPLEMSFSAIESRFQVIPSNPAQYSLKNLPKQLIDGLYTDGHLSASLYHLYFELRNLSKGQYSDILIKEIKLQILQIQPLPQRPVPLWMNDEPFHHESLHKYEALYPGTTSGFIDADYVNSDYITNNPGAITINPGETERVEVHLISHREVDILFSVQVIYFFAAESLPHTLILAPAFEAIFADKSDTSLYQLQNGHFVQSS